MLIRYVLLCRSSRAFVELVATPQDFKAGLGVACVQEGEPRPLLEAQAERGFAHVPEKSLEDLLMMKGKKVPDGDEDDIDRRTDLSMACIAAIKPDCTDIEAAAYVAKAFVAENPDVYLDPHRERAGFVRRVERRGSEDSCRVRARRQNNQSDEEAGGPHAQNELT